jgi:hypothetical protein
VVPSRKSLIHNDCLEACGHRSAQKLIRANRHRKSVWRVRRHRTTRVPNRRLGAATGSVRPVVLDVDRGQRGHRRHRCQARRWLQHCVPAGSVAIVWELAPSRTRCRRARAGLCETAPSTIDQVSWRGRRGRATCSFPRRRKWGANRSSGASRWQPRRIPYSPASARHG